MSYLDDFDPNAMPEPYATYTRGRTPYFKLHARLSHATAAMTNHRRSGVILYERQGGQWVQLARMEQNYHGRLDNGVPHQCDNCRASTVHSSAHGSGDLYNYAEQYLERDGGRGGKLVKPLNVLTLCQQCVRAFGYGY